MTTRFVPLGDTAFRAFLPEGATPRHVASIVRALSSIDGVDDVVATETAVAVVVRPGVSPDLDQLTRALDVSPSTSTVVVDHVIHVRYDGEDLDAVCEATSLSRDELIALHTGRRYEVKMIGFQPGFAYLGPLDPRLVIPRRSTPRARIAPSSLAIGGPYTGVYPNPSPGGWHLIGTALGDHPFKLTTPRPLAIGDRARFVRVDGS